MSKKYVFFTLVLLLAFVLAACTGGNQMTEEPEPTQPPMDETEEPTEAPPPMIDPSGQKVVWWAENGQVTDDRGEEMIAIVDEFNANNEWGITVEWVNQGRYDDIENAMNAGIQSGDIPNLVTAYPNAMSSWYLFDIMADLNTFISDPAYGLTAEQIAAVYESTLLGAQTPDGAQVAWPISQSGNVMAMNATWAAELGYDSPPTTSAEFKEMACAAQAANYADDDPDNDGTGGLVLYAATENVISWLWAFGGTVIDDTGEGYDFNTEEFLAMSTYLKDLQDSDCTLTTESYPNPEFATRQALFINTSSAGMRYVLGAFTDIGSEDEVVFLPFVGPDGGMAADAYVQYVGVVKATPEADLATWLFIRYLTSPEVQARWVVASKYFPTQSTTEPLVADFASTDAQWAALKDIISQYGVAESSLASWQPVRDAIEDDLFPYVLEAETTDDIVDLLVEFNDTAAEIVEETQ
jgi:ABC-type glycerol-3-phosphate transport system substrate-binding protein